MTVIQKLHCTSQSTLLSKAMANYKTHNMTMTQINHPVLGQGSSPNPSQKYLHSVISHQAALRVDKNTAFLKWDIIMIEVPEGYVNWHAVREI